ncbi:hypothetical protein ACJMK2_006606 [Sinanodonta woodiana]|uniref:Uncharacterized protein n=1 Tax=Sinanodonta woodiana TaxID=1069815 RepID=A0ABD3VTP7_SINWO
MMVLMLPPPLSASTTQSTSANISNFLSNNNVVKSKIVWTLHMVVTHASYKLYEHIADVFHIMFPDSALAAQFLCAEKKSFYLCVFDIAEHFKILKVSVMCL